MIVLYLVPDITVEGGMIVSDLVSDNTVEGDFIILLDMVPDMTVEGDFIILDLVPDITVKGNFIILDLVPDITVEGDMIGKNFDFIILGPEQEGTINSDSNITNNNSNKQQQSVTKIAQVIHVVATKMGRIKLALPFPFITRQSIKHY